MFNWCFIGAGKIADIVAKDMVESKINRVFSVWNRTYEKSIKFAEKYHAKVYKNVEEALNDPLVDGVYIALTNDLHFEYMKKCIEHHKPVLCEKPFTMNKKEAIEIFELAKKNAVYVSEAMWTWHNKCAYQVKDWLKDIGPIKEVECAFSFIGVSKEFAIERLINPNMLGGALLDIGVYGLRYSLELFGMPKKIRCSGDVSSGVDLNEEILFIYDEFTVKHSFAVDQDFGIYYRIKGERGFIDAPSFHATNEVILKKEKRVVIKDKNNLYETQFANVAKEIQDGLLESRIITKEKTILCMELMDECRRQMGLLFPKEK
ncbi:MAG: Gfo/Idh/MocA family oxidoreductase [Bacilli bacterium]|nr:Gfo/Idh/MocA family oxidoreductase [Bacilli bacterium]